MSARPWCSVGAIALSVMTAFSVIMAPPARAQRCEAPRVWLTVDRSSSMLGRTPDGTTKWSAAVTAIGELAAAYEGRVELALQVFPWPDRCAPGELVLAPGARSAAEVIAALGEPPPAAGSWTPMAQTLDVAAAHPSWSDPRARHLVLITDGWQWCDPHSSATRFLPIASVTRLRDMGVTVHVIGFGAGVDALTLNRAAIAAGTALPGCDASLADPRASNHCYAQVDDLAALRIALDEIARQVTEELCNGEDDDCDGQVDEGFDLDGDSFTRCGPQVDCDDWDEHVFPGAPERCNGIDDDCDGTIDPGCECHEGAVVACGSDVGACASGRQRCVGGVWGGCEGALGPVGETCDGRDEDCDGVIDEDADASCGAGSACTADGCVPLMPPVDPAPPDDVLIGRGPRGPATSGGCACAAAGRGRGSAPAAAGAGVVTLAWLVRRRSARRA